MQPQWPGNTSADAPTPKKSVAGRLPLLIGAVLVIAGITTGSLFALNSGGGSDVGDGDDSKATFVITQAVATQPVFEPRAAEGDDAFYPIDAQIRTFEQETGVEVSPSDVEAGLYGGTVENTCDPERLIDFLVANPDKAAAWADVQGIDVSEIGSYIRDLDARILAAPAVVINHGFDEDTGAATAIETTLEAGTAVLVDADGNIRTRCYCGNPVTPRPAVYREPRCLVSADLVFATPGGTTPIPADQSVELTGQISVVEITDWTEITWGDAATAANTGWTMTTNLQPTLCQASVPVALPDPTPTVSTATATPVPTATPTPSPEPEAAPEPTAAVPTATAAPAPTPTTSVAPAPTPTSEVTPTATATPAATCPDADGDGICNAEDNCRDVANAGQLDKDNDGKGNACDNCTDRDLDLHCAETDDTCPGDYDPSLQDTDRDGIGDVCDNCPLNPNPNQADADGNKVGDVCDGKENANTNDCAPSSYQGLDRGSAEAKAGRNDCSYRILRIDGETFFGTTDFVPDRMSWEIDNNIITRITLG